MLDENIRVMRREKGLTQEQLAEVMGVSTASVSKWETGVAVPELSMLAALADFFEMSIDALIGHTVGKAQLKEKIAEIKELSLANEDKKAIEQAEELLRRYPNEYDVVDCTSDAYYTAFIHNRETEYIHRCMELIHRKYALSKDSSGKKWFEMQKELANCHELLGEWKKKEQIRLAIRAEMGKDVTEDSNTAAFLQAEKPHQVIHTAFEGSQVVQLLTAMEEEELLEVAKEELEK